MLIIKTYNFALGLIVLFRVVNLYKCLVAEYLIRYIEGLFVRQILHSGADVPGNIGSRFIIYHGDRGTTPAFRTVGIVLRIFVPPGKPQGRRLKAFRGTINTLVVSINNLF